MSKSIWNPNHKGPVRELTCQNCKNRNFAKVFRFEQQRQQNFQGITEFKETKGSGTDKSIKVKTEIKHVIERKVILI